MDSKRVLLLSLLLTILFAGYGILWNFSAPRRDLSQAIKLSHRSIILLQNAMCSKDFFELETLNQIFHNRALKDIPSIEENMRSYYKVNPNIRVSLFGELLKIACPELKSFDLDNECYYVKKVTHPFKFEIIEGILISSGKTISPEYIYMKVNRYDCKIDVDNSIYHSMPLLNYLSILPSGRISNPQYEQQLLTILNDFRDSSFSADTGVSNNHDNNQSSSESE